MPAKHDTLIVFVLVACISLFAIPVFAASTTSSLSGDDALTRGSRFTISITGIPNTPYYVWLTRTWSLSGNPGDQPPVIVGYQWNVQQDAPGGPFTIGTYAYNNGNGRTILNDVAPTSATQSNTSYYALVTTDSAGTAVVAFQTSINTALQSYSVRVENPTSANNDTLLVKRADTTVKRGAVSIEVAITPTPPRIILPPQTPTIIPTSDTITETPTVLPTTVPSTAIPTQKVPLEPAWCIVALCLGVWMIRDRRIY
jgi:hypothetical protein